MNRILELTLIAALAASATPLALAQTSSASQNEENTRIRALFREGAALLTDGKYEEARDVLTKAWQLRQTADVATVLGQAELMSQHFRDAAEHLDWALRNFPPVNSEQRLQTTQNLFTDAKQHVGTVEIKVERPGLDVRVDGKSIGTSPLPSRVFVEPGTHVIAVGAAEANAQRTISAEPGGDHVVIFTEQEFATSPGLAAASKNAPPPPVVQPLIPQSEGTAPAPAQRDWTPVYWTAAIGGGLTAGSLIAAVLFRSHANSKQDEANAAASRQSPSSCYGAASPNCVQLASLLDDRNAASRNAQVSLGVAGALAVTTGIVTYFVWPKPNRADSRTAVWATPTSAGLGLTGTF